MWQEGVRGGQQWWWVRMVEGGGGGTKRVIIILSPKLYHYYQFTLTLFFNHLFLEGISPQYVTNFGLKLRFCF